jgi:hypothetical protein
MGQTGVFVGVVASSAIGVIEVRTSRGAVTVGRLGGLSSVLARDLGRLLLEAADLAERQDDTEPPTAKDTDPAPAPAVDDAGTVSTRYALRPAGLAAVDIVAPSSVRLRVR